MSDREAFDLFLGDMASHQANHVGEVTGKANQRLAAPLFERLDHQAAEEKPRGYLKSPPISADPPAVRQSDVEAAKRGFRIIREERELPAIAPPMSDLDLMRAAATRRRLDLLLSKVERGPLGQPSWAERLKAILVVQIVNPRTRTQVAREVNELIAESEIVFGPIFAERPRRIQVG